MTGVISPALVSTKRLEGTLVAPREKHQVPNHLTDTKIFNKTKTNQMLQVNPSVVYFNGFKAGDVHHHTLHIINSSKQNQQMHVIPPTTPFFTIKYAKKRSSLIPGLSLDVVIEFKPKEWQYHYDCVRIHCKDEDNILVPIHAYPVMDTANFPRNVTFEPTPIGQTLTKTISLRCGVPVDFEYQLVYVKSHPAFSINAMKGVVPANNAVNIKIEFSPTEFSTAIMTVKLELSQYNFTPIVCTFTGTSAPGLALRQLRPSTSGTALPSPAKPKRADIRRRARKLTKLRSIKHTTTSKVEKEIIRNGIIFPTDLDCPAAVGKVLLQKPGKIKASMLKNAPEKFTTGGGAEEGYGSRKIKEALYLQKVRQVAEEEKRNQLRWVTHLGDLPMTTEEIEQVYQEREKERTIYERHYHVTVPEEEFVRTETLVTHRRTRRKAGQVPDCPRPTFDPFLNNEWLRRHLALQKFVQAGRKVIIRLRCQAKLEKLQKVIREGMMVKQYTDEDLSVLGIVPLLPSTPEHILPFSFPKYKGPTTFGTGGGGGGGGNSNRELEIKTFSMKDIKKNVPYLDLKVPQQSKILGYSPLQLSEVSPYMPPGLTKNLLSGAKDEFECLVHIPGVDPSFLSPDAFTYATLSQPSPPRPHHSGNTLKSEPSSSVMSLSSAASTSAETISSSRMSQGSRSSQKRPAVLLRRVENKAKDSTVSIPMLADMTEVSEKQRAPVVERVVESERVMTPVIMPPSLSESPQLSSHQILNLTPGVTSYVTLLPNSEATLDHTLLPLPIYPSARYPQVRLDPIDGISQLMHWKKFPSPVLLTLNSDKKLATLWKPYFSDPFPSDLLPSCDQLPPLLSGIQPDDFVDTESTDTLPVPTMDMIKAEFYVPGSSEEQPVVWDSSPKSQSKGTQRPTIRQQPSALFHEAMTDLDKSRLNEFDQLGHRVKNKLMRFCGRVDSSVQALQRDEETEHID